MHKDANLPHINADIHPTATHVRTGGVQVGVFGRAGGGMGRVGRRVGRVDGCSGGGGGSGGAMTSLSGRVVRSLFILCHLCKQEQENTFTFY
jgi:hypothetical protein